MDTLTEDISDAIGHHETWRLEQLRQLENICWYDIEAAIKHYRWGGWHLDWARSAWLSMAAVRHIERGQLDAARSAIEAGADLDFPVEPLSSNFHVSALHSAVLDHERHLLAETLLELGADINNRKNTKAASPLHCAVVHGSVAGVKWLLEHGADPGLRDYRDMRPHDYVDVYPPAVVRDEIRALLDAIPRREVAEAYTTTAPAVAAAPAL